MALANRPFTIDIPKSWSIPSKQPTHSFTTTTMASLSLQSLLVASAYLFTSSSAINANLVGTWSTKSAKVLTGPVRSILGIMGEKVGMRACEDKMG